MKLTLAARTLLSSIHAATAQGGSLFIDTKSKDAKALTTAGLIDVNAQITNEQGHVAARTNEAGAEAATKQTGTSERAAPVRVAPPEGGFAILKAEEVPEAPQSRRGVGRESPYPFEKLGMGEAFFIPATADVADPAKKFASTISSANKRFAKNANDVRRFRIFAGTINGQAGAIVKRVAPETAPAA